MGEKDLEQGIGIGGLSSLYHRRVVREIPKLLSHETLLQGEPIIGPWPASTMYRVLSTKWIRRYTRLENVSNHLNHLASDGSKT